jgi:hypothetical protein
MQLQAMIAKAFYYRQLCTLSGLWLKCFYQHYRKAVAVTTLDA